MKIHVSAKAGRKNEYIKYVGRATFEIAVSEPPIKGKSNAAIIKTLSEYFNIPKSQIELTHGHKAKQKVFEIPATEEDIEKIEEKRVLQTKLF
jgi:uncharacterized protein